MACLFLFVLNPSCFCTTTHEPDNGELSGSSLFYVRNPSPSSFSGGGSVFRRGLCPGRREVWFPSVELILMAKGSKLTLTLGVRYCSGSALAPPLWVHQVRMGLTLCHLPPSARATPSAVVVMEVPICPVSTCLCFSICPCWILAPRADVFLASWPTWLCCHWVYTSKVSVTLQQPALHTAPIFTSPCGNSLT